MILYESGSTNHHKSKTTSETRQRPLHSQGPPDAWGTLRVETHPRRIKGVLPLKVNRGVKERDRKAGGKRTRLQGKCVYS